VLDGLRAACREQYVPEPVRRDLDDQPRRFTTDIRRMGGCERTEAVGLFLDGRNDARMLVTEVREDQLRAEVRVAPAVGVDGWLPEPPTKLGTLRGPCADQGWKTSSSRSISQRRATAPALHEGERGAPAAGLPKLGLAVVAECRQLVGTD
jgi:hypothetical protein